MLEQGHRRMNRVERQLERLYSNNAPTVPQYDLVPLGSLDDGNGFDAICVIP